MMSKCFKKIIVSVLFGILLALMLSACTTVEDKTTTSEITTAPTEATATTVEITVAPTTETSVKVSFDNEYKPVKAVDDRDTQVNLSVVYGSFYVKYKDTHCTLSFDDLSFTDELTAKGVQEGSVEILSDNEFDLVYSKTNIKHGTIISTDIDGVVTEFSLEQGDYTVVFSRSDS